MRCERAPTLQSVRRPARSKRFNLLLLLRDHLLLVVHFAMCFEELIEQHRVHCIVSHGLEFAVAIASHQIRTHLFHLWAGCITPNGSVTATSVPIRMLASAATPKLPMSMLLLPVVRFTPAPKPNAMLRSPLLLTNAPVPLAVFNAPVVLPLSAAKPVAVLSLPIMLFSSATLPVAVFSKPVVFERSASRPPAVLRSPVVF